MTESMTYLLDRAKRGGRCDVTTSNRGKRTSGTRLKNAAQKLVALGLLKHNGTHMTTHCPWGGETTYIYTTIYLLVEKEA